MSVRWLGEQEQRHGRTAGPPDGCSATSRPQSPAHQRRPIRGCLEVPRLMTGTDWQARVREALTRTEIMTLSSLDRDGGSWTSPVQYQWDSQLNLYFASMPDARHVGTLRRDARVWAAIYSFPGPPGGNLGLQLRGIATAIGAAGDRG